MKETLTRKYGPLPMWAWLLLFVAGLSYFLIRRRKQAALAAQAQQDQSGGTTGAQATNLGGNALSNLVPQAYPMPFQQGDVFTNITVPPPASTGTVTTEPTQTGTTTPATPSNPKYPNQVHAVGQVGQSYNLMAQIRRFYPNLSPEQQLEVGYATIADPKNKIYNLGSGYIPGGARVEFYSKAIK